MSCVSEQRLTELEALHKNAAGEGVLKASAFTIAMFDVLPELTAEIRRLRQEKEKAGDDRSAVVSSAVGPTDFGEPEMVPVWPEVPVRCLISELGERFLYREGMTEEAFNARVRQFHDEVGEGWYVPNPLHDASETGSAALPNEEVTEREGSEAGQPIETGPSTPVASRSVTSLREDEETVRQAIGMYENESAATFVSSGVDIDGDASLPRLAHHVHGSDLMRQFPDKFPAEDVLELEADDQQLAERNPEQT